MRDAMQTDFAIIGGDRRQFYLAEILQKRGYSLCTKSVPGLGDVGDLRTAEFLLLPVPATDGEGHIRGTELSPAEVSEMIFPHAQVFGGGIEHLKKVFPHSEDVLLWEDLTMDNAAITAEGALHHILTELPATVEGEEFLILGAGRIGMHLARRLAALGGKVTVSARQVSQRRMIEAMGFVAEETGTFPRGLEHYACLCNTIPSPVLSKEQLSHTRHDCLILELASAPGGCFPEDCEALGKNFIIARGLPGVTAPRTAAEVLAKHILARIGASKEESYG